jgi:hypothetical protein
MNEQGQIAYFASQEIAKAHGYGINLTMEQATQLLALPECDRIFWYGLCKKTGMVQPIPDPDYMNKTDFSVEVEGIENPWARKATRQFSSTEEFKANFEREMNEAGLYIQKPSGVGATVPGSSSFKKRKPKIDSRNNGGGKRTGKNGNKPNKAR